VYYNNQEILTQVPDTFSVPGLLAAGYHQRGVRLDEGTRQDVYVVDLLLPDGVHISVNRWERHIDATITMSRLPYQDGFCGNFNGVKDDDNIDHIKHRVPGQVPRSHLLFPTTNFNEDVVKPKSIHDCKPEVLRLAQDRCRHMNRHAGDAFVSACIFDVCFQGTQYAVEDSATAKQHSMHGA
jgi:hypothetical protein